jgi:uncharacterized protein (TIGR02145 family)
MRNNWTVLLLVLLTACYSDREHTTVTDIDGTIYRTVTIGDQVWMADNLQVTRFRNGDAIPVVSDAAAWGNLSTGAYCYYGNDANNNASYGKLYNWYAINDSRGIAPEGWHIPTEEELIELAAYLKGDTIAAGKMKAKGTSHWLVPNTGATNESGFSALPGGYRLDNGSYHTMGSNGYWWSTARSYEMYAWTARLYTGFADVRREPYYEKYGFAVRCIKDQPKAERQAKAEQVVEGFDHSLNRISKAHYHFPNIDGRGLVISIKEDLFDTEDIDFKNRYLPVSLAANKISPHAGMMATLIGGGGNSFYKSMGVAKGSMLTSSSFKNLVANDDGFYATNHITVQNHSYGTDIENYYGNDAASYDKSTVHQLDLLHVFSSGNSGGSMSTAGKYKDIEGVANLTGSFKMSKNSIVVAAIDSFGNSMDYISRGPAYDGRLKPELSACTNSGSSGAAALVSGSALLVQQLYKEKYQQLPEASLVKAILINTADDAGARGIDFKTGYGSLNLFKALMSVEQGNFLSGIVRRNTVKSFTITIPANVKELKLTLTWTDPPALANAATALINDLDMTLIHSNGQKWLPWVLSSFAHKDSLELSAVRKRDDLNNTEQITIDNPPAGNYVINVAGYAVLDEQSFHIAWGYAKKNLFSWDYPVATDNLLPGESNMLRWDNSFDARGLLQWSGNGSSEWQTIQAQADLSKNYLLWSVPDTVSTAQLRMVIGSEVFVSDIFSISRPISFEVSSNCMDSVKLSWSRQPNIVGYRIYGLGEKYLEPLAVTGDTKISLPGTGLSAAYFSIAPVFGNGREGVKSSSVRHMDRGMACGSEKGYLVYPNPVFLNQSIKIASTGTADDIFQLYTTEGKLLLQQRLATPNSTVSILGLGRGVYIYNIRQKGVTGKAGRLVIK